MPVVCSVYWPASTSYATDGRCDGRFLSVARSELFLCNHGIRQRACLYVSRCSICALARAANYAADLNHKRDNEVRTLLELVEVRREFLHSSKVSLQLAVPILSLILDIY